MDKLSVFLRKQDEIIAADRAKTLIALGLTEREYAPDDAPSPDYPGETWEGGRKRYFREVALSVTDEEYAQIIAKASAVAEIREKEAAERAQKGRRTVRQWLPIFTPPMQKDENGREIVPEENGKSKLAPILRILALVFFAVGIIGGLVLLNDSVLSFLTTTIAAVAEALLLYAAAEILDYLATLTAIAKHGYRYEESGKK